MRRKNPFRYNQGKPVWKDDTTHSSNIDIYINFHKDYIKNCKPYILTTYLKEVKIGNHRCDVLIEYSNGLKVAVELQCSSISKDEIYDRTFNYLHNGYCVEWVVSHDYCKIFSCYGLETLLKYCAHLGYKVSKHKSDVAIHYIVLRR